MGHYDCREAEDDFGSNKSAEPQPLSAAEPETEDAARLRGAPPTCCELTVARAADWLIRHGQTMAGERLRRGFPWPEQLHDAQQLTAGACECPSRSALVKGMVDRFLSWRLPDNFNPDGGVTFSPHRDAQGWPVGTNLLDADQAESMIRHILALAAPCPCVGLRERLALLEGPFHGAAPAGTSQADIVRARAAITDAYIRDGEPAQKVNWMYGQAITQSLRAEVAKAERDSLRAELAAATNDCRKANISIERIYDALDSWGEWDGEPHTVVAHIIAEHQRLAVELTASQERERVLKNALEPFAIHAVVHLKMSALGLGQAPMLITDADWKLAVEALATPEGTRDAK